MTYVKNWREYVILSSDFAIWCIEKFYLATTTLRLYLSRLRYGIIFWGESPSMQRIFEVAKIGYTKYRGLRLPDSRKSWFKAMQILLPTLRRNFTDNVRRPAYIASLVAGTNVEYPRIICH